MCDIPGLGKYCFSCSAVLKDQAKFDTQNLVISSLLTLIEIGKKQNEENTKKHLSSASSVQDLKIGKLLQRLSQFSINRPIDGNDDDDDNNGKTPSALAQGIMLGIDGSMAAQTTAAAVKKLVVKKLVALSKSLNWRFQKCKKF